MRRLGAIGVLMAMLGVLPGVTAAAAEGVGTGSIAPSAGEAPLESEPPLVGREPLPGGSERPSQEFVIEGPVVIRAPRRDGNFLRDYLRRNTIAFADEDSPSRAPGFPRMERYELSRSETAFRGLGTGATLGLWAGALGSSFGWWGEDEALLMMGAMSAAGAAWAGTRGDARHGLRWRPPAN